MAVARRKRELQETRRLERTKRKQRFAEKKMRITRQVVLGRVVNLISDRLIFRNARIRKLGIRLLFIYVENVIMCI